MGKTSLALGIARHVGVEANLPVAVFSPRDDAGTSDAAADVRRGPRRLAEPAHRPDAAGGLGRAWSRACDRLSRAPIYIDDTAGINVMEIRSKARRLKSVEKGLSLIVVDYLQLMRAATRPRTACRRSRRSPAR